MRRDADPRHARAQPVQAGEDRVQGIQGVGPDRHHQLRPARPAGLDTAGHRLGGRRDEGEVDQLGAEPAELLGEGGAEALPDPPVDLCLLYTSPSPRD